MTDILKEADGLISSDRHESYGHPLDNFNHTAALWSAYKGIIFTPEDVGMMMILVKMSREKHMHKKDNLIDMAGYTGTVAMVIEEKLKREPLLDTFGPIEEYMG